MARILCFKLRDGSSILSAPAPSTFNAKCLPVIAHGSEITYGAVERVET